MSDFRSLVEAEWSQEAVAEEISLAHGHCRRAVDALSYHFDVLVRLLGDGGAKRLQVSASTQTKHLERFLASLGRTALRHYTK